MVNKLILQTVIIIVMLILPLYSTLVPDYVKLGKKWGRLMRVASSSWKPCFYFQGVEIPLFFCILNVSFSQTACGTDTQMSATLNLFKLWVTIMYPPHSHNLNFRSTLLSFISYTTFIITIWTTTPQIWIFVPAKKMLFQKDFFLLIRLLF